MKQFRPNGPVLNLNGTSDKPYEEARYAAEDNIRAVDAIRREAEEIMLDLFDQDYERKRK